MTKPSGPDTDGYLRAIKANARRGPRRKSPVYEWLAARHDELVAAFKRTPPSWTVLAKYLAEGGVLNADGVPPTPSAVRTSWLRVEADLARKRSGRRGSSPDAPSPAPAAPVQRHDPPPVDPAIDDDDGGYDFDKRVIINRGTTT